MENRTNYKQKAYIIDTKKEKRWVTHLSKSIYLDIKYSTPNEFFLAERKHVNVLKFCYQFIRLETLIHLSLNKDLNKSYNVFI